MSSNGQSQPSLFESADVPDIVPVRGPKEAAAAVASPRPERKACLPRKPRCGGPAEPPHSASIDVKPAQRTNAGVPAYVSVADVARHFSVSVPTIWRWAKTRAEFPKPVVLSPGTTRWRLTDLVAFEQTLGAGA